MGVLMAKVETESLAALLTRVARALGLSQGGMGELAGSSRKTVGRWQAGRAAPSSSQVDVIAHALLPIDRELALALVLAYNDRLSTPELQPYHVAVQPFLPPPAAPASPKRVTVEPHLIDAIVYAACAVADLSPKALRGAVAAAFQRAHELGLDNATVAEALSTAPAPERASPDATPPARKAERATASSPRNP
jgi:hypothetical protein